MKSNFQLLAPKGGQISPLMHVPLCAIDFVSHRGITLILISMSAIQLGCLFDVLSFDDLKSHLLKKRLSEFHKTQ